MSVFKPTNVRIAQVHLTSNLRQTIVAVLSVTFGISMYVFMNSFMAGVNNTQADLVFSTVAHLHIYNDGPPNTTNLLAARYPAGWLTHLRNAKVVQYTEGIRNSREIAELLEDRADVVGLTPQVNLNLFYRSNSIELNGQLSGVDVDREEELFGTSKYVVEGEWAELSRRPDGVIIGSGLARRLSLGLNDNLNILTADGVARSYQVVGIFETTIAGIDKTRAYLNIGSARQLLGKNQDYATDVQVNLARYETARDVARSLAPLIPYKVESWQEANGQQVAASQLRDIIAIAVSLTVLIVAGFGIYNIMNMTVNSKIREIAILKAMGFSGSDVSEIFLLQAIVIGVIGGLAGMMLGFVVALVVSLLPFEIATLSTLPMAYEGRDYLMAFTFGLATTFLAGYLPARKAAQVDPVSIIRG